MMNMNMSKKQTFAILNHKEYQVISYSSKT